MLENSGKTCISTCKIAGFCYKLDNIYKWIFTSAVDELRGVFGVMIGQIAKAYGLDVEDELAQLISE